MHNYLIFFHWYTKYIFFNIVNKTVNKLHAEQLQWRYLTKVFEVRYWSRRGGLSQMELCGADWVRRDCLGQMGLWSRSCVISFFLPASGRGDVWTSHSGLSQISRFWLACSYTFSAHFVKISDPGHWRSGHQVTSSDLTSEKVWMFVIATPNDRSRWYPFNDWYS